MESEKSKAYLVDHAGRIPRIAFKGVIGAFFGLAIISVVARLAIWIYTARRLHLDDAFLLFGVVCLCAATGLVIHICDIAFLSEAVLREMPVIPDSNEIRDLLSMLPYVDAFLILMWTATFAVKFSFLAFFKMLIKSIANISTYYWVVVVFTALVWGFLVSETFILCHYFGAEEIKCLPQAPYHLSLALTITITVLDIITDLMIISIPIIILRRSQIKTSQQFALGFFLCLSFMQIIVAIIRNAGTRISPGNTIDLTWALFWQYMEGCIAVIMVSLTAFRNLLVNNGSRASDDKPHGPSYSLRQRILDRRRAKRTEDRLPAIPSATLSGVRTYIRRNNRAAGSTTVDMLQSNYDRLEDGNGAWRSDSQRIYVTHDLSMHSNRDSVSARNIV